MGICTWKFCNGEATHPLFDRDRNEWANLCDKHFQEEEEAFDAYSENSNASNCATMLSVFAKAKYKNFIKQLKG